MVAALRAHGIPTTASCQGHLDRGLPYPWVEICADLPQVALEEEEQELRNRNLALRWLLLARLGAFYSEQDIAPFDVLLSLRPYAMRQFRLQSAGAEAVALAPPPFRGRNWSSTVPR